MAAFINYEKWGQKIKTDAEIKAFDMAELLFSVTKTVTLSPLMWAAAANDMKIKVASPQGEQTEPAEPERKDEMSEMQTNQLAGQPQPAYANREVGIIRQGEKIILPSIPVPMHEQTAIDYLQRKLKQDVMVITVNEEIDCHPLEGAWALKKVLEARYGWAESSVQKIQTMFGTKEVPPQLMSIEVEYQKFEKVIWGEFRLPGIEAKILCSGTKTPKGPVFVIAGQTLKKYENDIKAIADDVRLYVRQNSLYRSKAIILKTDNDGEVTMENPPTFLDLSRVKEDELIFSADLTQQVVTNLFTPIEQTDLCRKHSIPLKRGILLEGKYGTGKTLAAYVAAKKAVRNGWTFIYLDRVAGLNTAIEFAKRYEPAIIFAEDIDRTMSGERDVEVDDILNTIDGIGSKNREVMVILTTNDVTAIEKAMLRPGRLDAVISFSPPDSIAAEKLIRLYARGLVSEGENLKAAGKELDGQIPAVIREVVERSKLYAISHTPEGDLKLTGEDIAQAARGMKNHLALLNHTEATQTPLEKIGGAFVEGMTMSMNGMKKNVEETKSIAEDIRDNMN